MGLERRACPIGSKQVRQPLVATPEGGLGIPMIVTADSGDRDRAVPGPWI